MSQAPAQARQGRAEGLSIRPQTLTLAPEYRRLRDAILRPHLRLTESRYFWERWKPLLGADATVLIMEVRDRCNRALATSTGLAGTGLPNGSFADSDRLAGGGHDGSPAGSLPPATGEGCTVSANELAAACGFSRVTLWRLLQREEVRRFIRVEHNYVYDRRLGKKRRTVSTYHVLMEDPLVPEDEPRLEQMIEAQASPPLPTVHFETQVADNSPPRFQPETTRSGSSLKPQNVFETTLKERLANAQNVHAETSSRFDHQHAPALTSTSVAARQRASVPELDIWKKYPELAHHVEEAERLLGDQHSRGFYLTALKRLYPGHMDIWQRALGLAREQQNIRRSRGALFTRLLRTFADEAGVRL